MKRTRALLLAALLVPPAAAPAADEAVLSDLAGSDIPTALRSGAVAKVDGTVALRDGAAFAVPTEAFPDRRNFTRIGRSTGLPQLIRW